MEDFTSTEWFTLEDIIESDNTDTLYCISVDSPERQFLIGEKIAVSTHNSEQGKAEDALKGEAAMIIGSIARLGRAAGVHLVIATQRPDANIISGETKANLGVRINCGRTDSNASSMILGTGDGTRVKSNPKGRLYLRIFGAGDHGQGFFAQPSWIDDYLTSQGLNPDGTPLTSHQSRLANVTDMSQFEDADLDTREGIDNSAIIDQIREEEANIDISDDGQNNDDEDFDGFINDDDEDWGFDEDDSAPSQTSAPPAPTPPHKDDRPELTNGANSGSNPWDRPEDDWDNELEALIEENNN